MSLILFFFKKQYVSLKVLVMQKVAGNTLMSTAGGTVGAPAQPGWRQAEPDLTLHKVGRGRSCLCSAACLHPRSLGP